MWTKANLIGAHLALDFLNTVGDTDEPGCCDLSISHAWPTARAHSTDSTKVISLLTARLDHRTRQGQDSPVRLQYLNHWCVWV